MKVKYLISLLQDKDPEVDVLILLRSSCYNDIQLQHVKDIAEAEYDENYLYEIELIERGTKCIVLSHE